MPGTKGAIFEPSGPREMQRNETFASWEETLQFRQTLSKQSPQKCIYQYVPEKGD